MEEPPERHGRDRRLLTVRQVTLSSRATLPLDAVPGLELLSVVSGQLQALDPPDANDTANPLLLPQEVTRQRLLKGTAAMGTFRPGRVVAIRERNRRRCCC